MPFDLSKPANNTPANSTEMRAQLNALKALIDALQVGQTPIGGLVSWLKNKPGTPPLAANFVECNGQTLSDPESPYDGTVIDDLNGVTGPQRFLRGASASGGTGGAETHSHSVDLSSGAGDFQAGTDAYAAGTSPLNTGDASSLPSYYEVVIVMRVK